MNRRIFSKMGLTSLLLPISIKDSRILNNKEMEDIYVHHVYFWLNDPKSEADKAKLIEGLEKLTSISSLKSFHIGMPAKTNRGVIDSSYQISWLTIFKNEQDEQAYQIDPIHLDFVTDYKHLWSKVIVYDSVDLKIE